MSAVNSHLGSFWPNPNRKWQPGEKQPTAVGKHASSPELWKRRPGPRTKLMRRKSGCFNTHLHSFLLPSLATGYSLAPEIRQELQVALWVAAAAAAGVRWTRQRASPSLAPFFSSVTTTEVFRQPMARSRGLIPLKSTCSITAPLSTRYWTCTGTTRM